MRRHGTIREERFAAAVIDTETTYAKNGTAFHLAASFPPTT